MIAISMSNSIQLFIKPHFHFKHVILIFIQTIFLCGIDVIFHIVYEINIIKDSTLCVDCESVLNDSEKKNIVYYQLLLDVIMHCFSKTSKVKNWFRYLAKITLYRVICRTYSVNFYCFVIQLSADPILCMRQYTFIVE